MGSLWNFMRALVATLSSWMLHTWLKACSLFGPFPHWGLLYFWQEALSSVTPPWPFFMAYWPQCSEQAPISALERPLVRSAMIEDVGCLLLNDKYCVAAVCSSVNLSVCYKACLLFGYHGWKACVFQVNVLSAPFVPVLAHISVCTVQYSTCTLLAYISVCSVLVMYMLCCLFFALFN